jgi:peroxiredoxin
MFDDVSSQGLPLEAAPPVGVGDPAPDVTVADATGAPVRLADLWRAGPLVLVFSRHLG